MPSFILRVWVPDRPGALGAVASRIGAVRGDLVGIDILERGGGRAIDELVVDLPDESLVDLLVSEVSQVDGVDVEDVRMAPEAAIDPRVDALETAASLVAHAEVGSLLEALARRSLSDFQSDWVAVVDLESTSQVVTVGAAPPSSWLGAFVTGQPGVSGSRFAGGSRRCGLGGRRRRRLGRRTGPQGPPLSSSRTAPADGPGAHRRPSVG